MSTMSLQEFTDFLPVFLEFYEKSRKGPPFPQIDPAELLKFQEQLDSARNLSNAALKNQEVFAKYLETFRDVPMGASSFLRDSFSLARKIRECLDEENPQITYSLLA